MPETYSFAFRPDGTEVALRLIATTDLHANVFPFDYLSDRPTGNIGLACAALLVDAMRAGVPNSLLLDNGDFLQGSPLGDYIAFERGLAPGQLHPMIEAMNRLGYDAATLGNHEFNFGLDFLHNALAGADFPVVSANLVTARGDTPTADATLVSPYRILDRDLTCADGHRRRIRIGIIGFLPPQTALWDRDLLRGRAETRDIVECARAWVPRMRAEGADLVIALAHSGIGAESAEPGMENAATALAAGADVDAVIAGHSHQVFPSQAFSGVPGVDALAGTIGGKPAVMAGYHGSHLGIIDLLLAPQGDGWRVRSARSEVHPVGGVAAGLWQGADAPVKTRVLAAAASDHAATRHYMARALGWTEVALATHFSLLAETPALRLVCDAQATYVRRHLEGTDAEGLPVLSAAAPFRMGGRPGPSPVTYIPPGPISMRNLADLYCFPNVIRAVRATGAEIAEWLERSAAAFWLVAPGKAGQPLFDPDFPSYNFDMISGLSYRFDLSAPARYDRQGHLVDPAGGRLRGLQFEGRPVDPKAEFVVATNNYRVAQMVGLGLAPQVILAPAITNRALLVRHVETVERIVAPGAPRWWIMLPHGASAEFDTGLAALDGASALPDLEVRSLGQTAPGVLRLRLRSRAMTAAAE